MLEVAGLELPELSGGPFQRTAIRHPAHVGK